MMFYQEEVLVPWAAIKLDRPVKWIEDRSENFVATTHERNQVHNVEAAFSQDGRILGVHDVFLHDQGAYAPYGLTVALNSQCTLLGPYDIANLQQRVYGRFHQQSHRHPLPGRGRQHGVFVIERLLDLAARELGIDKAEIRRRNFIPPDKFPYDNEIIYQDFGPLKYDSGNYEPVLDKALAMIGYDDFYQNSSRRRGRRAPPGLGIVAYVEGTGIGPYEGARVQVTSSGRVSVATGIGTQGRATSPASPKSWPIRWALTCRSRFGDRRYRPVSLGGRHLCQSGAPSWPATPSTKRRRDVRAKILKLASDISKRPKKIWSWDGEVRVKGVPDRADPLGAAGPAGQPDARRRQARYRAGP